MLFKSLRQRMKIVIIVCSAAMAISAILAGGTAIFSGGAAAVAKVNGHSIQYPAWQSVYIQLVQNQAAAGYNVTPDQSETMQYFALQQLINQELLRQEAKNRKIKISKADIDAELANVKANFSDDKSFKEALSASNLNEVQLRRIIEENLKLAELKHQVTSNVTVTVDEVKEAYEEVSASHILVKPENDTEEAKAAARAKAERVLERLRSGEDFAAVAKEVSDDLSTAQDGGRLGFFKRGEMVPEFEEAAFSLNVGEMSDIVETKYGFHIIKVDDKKVAEGEEFEKAEPEIRESIRAEKEDRAFLDWFENLKSSAKIEILSNQMKGYEHLLNGELEEAVESYKLAIKENSSNPYLYARLASVYKELGQTEQAVEQMEMAVEKGSTDAQLHFELGELYRELDRREDALRAYSKASELDSMNFILHLQLINAYQAMGEEELVKAEEAQLEVIRKVWEESRKAKEEAESEASSETEGQAASSENVEEVSSEQSESESQQPEDVPQQSENERQ